MSQAELLTTQERELFLRQAVSEGLCGTLSSLHQGRWNVIEVLVAAVDPAGLHLKVMSEKTERIDLKKNHPVGVCLQKDHHKYIFESCISQDATIGRAAELLLEMPEKIEKMKRRAYERQPIPAGLNVKALFWHRGYMHGDRQAPQEDYWQGRLENLSAGGAMIRMEPEHRESFSTGQLVGVQFTPMSYQKPLLLEGHVRHLKTPQEEEGLTVGVEFLGLEASSDGHTMLHRLLDVIAAYEKMNKKGKTLD